MLVKFINTHYQAYTPANLQKKTSVNFGWILDFSDTSYYEDSYTGSNRSIQDTGTLKRSQSQYIQDLRLQDLRSGYFDLIRQDKLDLDKLKEIALRLDFDKVVNDFRDEENRTTLHILAEKCDQKATELMGIMIERKININAQDDYGNTPLLTSLMNENFLNAALLLEKKADPNIQNIAGDTAMHYACKSGNVEIVKLLNECNARSDLKNEANKTPADYAKEEDHDKILKILKPKKGRFGFFRF